MIILVEERLLTNYNYRQSFFFDTDKVDNGVLFEATYLNLITRALESGSSEAMVRPEEDITARFDDYQDGTHDWSYLLAQQPCRIDGQIILWIR